MTDGPLVAIRDIIQEDVGQRGLATDPHSNLLTAYPDDFARACRSLAETPAARVAIVTGFYIPHGNPPGGETDGPLGAVFLARALVPLGVDVTLITDTFCTAALHAGLRW
jgi:D-glutamate cyclase